MTDKEYAFQKKRVLDLRKKWHSLLGLGWWKVEFNFCREPKDSSEKSTYAPKAVGGFWSVVMETSSDPYYLTANVTCYLTECMKLDDSDLEETYLHEMMHIFLAPMQHNKKSGEEERVATSLARAFQWVGEDKEKKVKN